MLNMEEINAEIELLEKSECTTYNVCEKLAILYIVREHFGKSATNKNISTTRTVNNTSVTNGMTAM